MSSKFLFLLLIGILVVSGCNSTNTNTERKSYHSYKDSIAMIREIEEEAKPAYIEAYTKVAELRQYIRLAEAGQLTNDEVVAEFNRNFGGELGRLKTLQEVKQRMDTAGDGYIKFRFLKAQADIALRKAAEKQFEINSLDSIK